MPEGGEVKIVGEGLAALVSGKEISSITPISGRYLKNPIEGLRSEPYLWPQKVVGVGVKGKLVYWILENNTFILNTLAMTGGWSADQKKHSRVKFDFEDGTTVFFNDVRNFGTLKIIEGKKRFLDKLSSLGPDMLSEDINDDDFKSRLLLQMDKTLPEVLMNQSIICGVGNYVKAEALYRARLSPHRTVFSLNDDDFSLLNRSIKEVLRAAYKDQGASIRDYKTVDGKEGAASLSFMVYGRKKDPTGNNVIRETTRDGRATHWCPEVQI